MMRIDERAHEVSLLQSELEIEIWKWFRAGPELSAEEELNLINIEIRDIVLDMMGIKHVDRFSTLKDLVRDYQKKYELTDIEILQPLYSMCSTNLKYMLRYERHGDTETPAMVTPKKTKKKEPKNG
jgi:hypothetical protein